MSIDSRDSLQQEHILTIVIEDYFQVGSFRDLIPNDYWRRFESRLHQNIQLTLELLEKSNNKATFFVCGWIADNHPQLLQEIIKRGHGIGCQGYYHYGLDELSPEDMVADIVRSKEAVENAIGQEVQGFRVGRGGLCPEHLWLLDKLVELGFEYDSSLSCTGLKFRDQPYRETVHTHISEQGELYEVPVTTTKIGFWSVPISGGNYWRQFPARIMQQRIERWHQTHSQPMVLYFHIWELDPDQPKISAASPLQKLRHYRNLSTMKWKISHYLRLYNFVSIEQHLALEPPKVVQPRISAMQPSVDPSTIDLTNATPITLVIPCYNEEQTLPYLRNTLLRFAAKSAEIFDLHYVFVDDGSSDQTWSVLQTLFADFEQIKFIQHRKNKGIAAAIVNGFAEVNTDLCAVLDADCTFGPEQLMMMLPMLKDGVDVVSASPAHQQGMMQNVSLFRQSLSKGSAFLYSCVLHNKLTSYTSCFRLYRSHFVKDLNIYHNGFCGVTEILGRLDLAGANIVEYPATLEVRLLGASKINVLGTVLEHLKLVGKFAANRWLGRALPSRSFAEDDPNANR